MVKDLSWSDLPSRKQLGYLRFLERACDVEPRLNPSRTECSGRITELESQYRIIYDRQPAMR